MSTWRRKAIEILPEEKIEFEDPRNSVYTVFAYLLSALNTAQEQKNTERIKKIFAFAEWCFRQKQKDLWNAAGVSFYEHLDTEEALKTMSQYVKPDIYKEIRPLLEVRITPEQLKRLDESFASYKLRR